MIADLNPLLRGWAGYFGFSQLRELASLDGWITAAPALRRLGPVEDARQTLSGAPSPQGPEKVGQCGHLQPEGTVAAERRRNALHRAFTNSSLPSSRAALHGNAGGRLIRRTAVVRTRMPGGVGGAASRDAPLSRLRPAFPHLPARGPAQGNSRL